MRLIEGVNNIGTSAPQLNVDGQGYAITGTPAAADPTAPDYTTIGSGRDGIAFVRPFDGVVHQVFLYDAALNATLREEIAICAVSNYGTANNA